MKVNSPTQIEDLKRKAVQVLHKFIRERDSDGDYFTCITCGKVKHVSEMQAGHYLSAASNSMLKYEPDAINGECWSCNYYKKNDEAYRRNLVKKIGIDRVEELDALKRIPVKWERDFLEHIINTYK